MGMVASIAYGNMPGTRDESYCVDRWSVFTDAEQLRIHQMKRGTEDHREGPRAIEEEAESDEQVEEQTTNVNKVQCDLIDGQECSTKTRASMWCSLRRRQLTERVQTPNGLPACPWNSP